MNYLCIRCGSKEHTTREHDEGKLISLKDAQRSQRLNPKQKSSLDKRFSSSGSIQQRVCWRSVGVKPGIPEVIDRPLSEPWIEPRASLQIICRESNLCPCLSCENKRKKQKLEWERRMNREDGVV